MALQTKTLTANGAKGHHKFTLTVTENSTSSANNTSSLSFSFVLSSIQTSWNWEQWGSSISYTVNINGSTYTGTIPSYDGYSSVTLKSGSLSVGHDSEGKKSISVSFNVTDSTGQYYTCGNASSSSTMTLTTIPRSSTITSVSNVTLGNKCSVKFTPASASYYYNIKFSLGTWSANTGLFCPGKTTEHTYDSYVIPANDTLYKLIPNSPTGTMTATLTTYSSNSTSAQIGTVSSKTFTVTVPSNVVPSVGTITLNPVDINGQNILVQGKNRLTISVSGCTAGSGSGIKSYTFSGPGISTTTTNTSATSGGTISNTGTLTYTVKVTDNRGRTDSKTATITCYAHTAPSIKLNAYRVASSTGTTEDDSGTYVRCAFNLTFASVNSTNDTTVKIYYKKSTATTWSSVTALTDSKNTSGSYTLSSINAESTYVVYATVTDNYSGSDQSSSVTIFSAKRILNISNDGTGVAFGKMAEEPNCVDVPKLISRDSITVAKNNAGIYVTNAAGEVEPGIYKNSDNLWIGAKATNNSHITGGTFISAGDNVNGIYVSKLVDDTRTNYLVLDANNYTTYVTQKPTSLYNNTSGTNGTITLSSSAANFTYLEIFYADNNKSQPSSVKVYSPNGKYVSMSCIEPSTTNTEPRVYIRTSGWTISGTSMTVGRTDLDGANRGVYTQLYKNAGGTNVDVSLSANNYIKIFRVLGYK